MNRTVWWWSTYMVACRVLRNKGKKDPDAVEIMNTYCRFTSNKCCERKLLCQAMLKVVAALEFCSVSLVCEKQCRREETRERPALTNMCHIWSHGSLMVYMWANARIRISIEECWRGEARKCQSWLQKA